MKFSELLMRGLLLWVIGTLFAWLIFMSVGCAAIPVVIKPPYTVDVRRPSKYDLYICGFPEERSRLDKSLACVPLEDYADPAIPHEPQHVL